MEPLFFMKFIDLSFLSPCENLALDEALLDICEEGFPDMILRFWEPQSAFVVVGYTNKIEQEVYVERCQELNVPIYRRSSGGGTIVQGPGCLNYTLILKIPHTGPLKHLSTTNAWILQHHQKALTPLLGQEVKIQGTSDLAINDLKFSGNAQKRKRHFFLYHGTFLLHFDIALAEKILPLPSREPDYRKSRSHEKFLKNITASSDAVKEALKNCWGADEEFNEIPHHKIRELCEKKYANQDWISPIISS